VTSNNVIPIYRFWLTTFLALHCISAVAIETFSPRSLLLNETLVGAASLSYIGMSNPTLWEGESAGHQAQGDPRSDNVTFLVYLGRVQAAIGRANHYDKEAGMRNPFTPQILEQYAQIDPFVSGDATSNLSLQPLLSKIAAPETFAIIIDKSSTTRMPRNAIHTELKTLIGRVDTIVTERFPSTQSSALAMSALLREAGELLRTGLSVNGQIINMSDYRDALQLMEASLRLRVKKVAACEKSRMAIKQLKSNGPLGDLLDQLIIVSPEGTVGGNAGDVFEAARKLQQLGANLPASDKQICQ
jgi:hypothetical protein